MMITVVNLNPCLDWSWRVNDFAYGGMNRVQSARQDAAGKGINVCLALKNIGVQGLLCTGFNFRENGAAITQKMDNADVPHDFITVDGAVRVNVKLYDSSGTMTELNQPGSYVPPSAQDALMQKIWERCAGTLPHESGNHMLVLSGSRPAGVPVDFYARLCASWKGPVMLDTEGEALRLAINTAPPFCIKPNLFELESTFGVKLPTREDIAAFCRTLIAKGVQMVCVSLGAEGAMLVTETETHFLPALKLDVKAVQGAGDAMVAGLVYGLTRNAAPRELLRCAMAAAAATIVLEGTEMCSREGFEEMLESL